MTEETEILIRELKKQLQAIHYHTNNVEYVLKQIENYQKPEKDREKDFSCALKKQDEGCKCV